MKNILVTGGAGFIGSNFVRLMLAEHESIRIVNLDALTYAGTLENLEGVLDDARHEFVEGSICDASCVQRIFEAFDIDTVVNFAAESHVDRSIDGPALFQKTNVEGAIVLLDAARQHWESAEGAYGDVRFLQISTDEVYGSLGEEGYFTEETPLAPRSPYSASKAAADLFVQAYGETYGLPYNITRCTNNYGPRQYPEKLIPLTIGNALALKPLPVYGDGLNVRDWLYVDDHCRAIDLVLKEGVPGRVYNVGGSNEVRNIDLVRLIVSYLHENADAAITESLIEFVKDRKGHDRRYAIDASRIEGELGWKPRVMFESGIEETIRWYLQRARSVKAGVQQGTCENGRGA